MMKKGDYKNDMGNKAAKREKMIGGGMMMRKEMGHGGGMYGDDKRKKKGMGGRMNYMHGGAVKGNGTQPEYKSGEMPKCMPN